MGKQRINGGLLRWKTLFLVFALLFGTISVPVKVYANPYGGGDGNCTSTAWRLAYEKTGVQLPHWDNAGTWYNSARNAGYTVSTVPRAQSIAVWSGGPSGAGHVAYVSQVSGNQIYIQEGGYSGGYHEGWENAYGQTKYYHLNYLTMVGYIYLGNEVQTKVNLGDFFYAFITNANCNLDATAVDGDVKLKKEVGTGNQVFQFTRLNDGSYQILECVNKNSLDVFNASPEMRANVGICAPNNSSAQKWYITGNAPYTIHAACTDCVLSAAWGATSDGASVNMENDGQGDWQRWNIRKLAGVGKTTIYVHVDQKQVTFNWLQASQCNHYSLRIFKNGKEFLSEYNLKVLSKTVELEPGTYTAYIDSCNAYSFLKSNEVTFTVAESTDDSGVTACSHPNKQTQGAREVTCTADGYTGDVVCVDCHEVIERGTVIPAEGHAWGDFITVREADCVHEGERQRACENCGETETEKIAALGHVVVEDEAVPATTSSDGLTKGSHCGVCGEILEEQKTVPKLTSPQPPSTACSHSNTQAQGAREATCTADGYTGDLICVDCHEVIEQGRALPAGGHAWGEWRIVREADCTHDGEQRRSCADCGETETGKIAALGHVVAKGESRCSVCGEAVKNQNKVPVQTTKNPQSSQKPQNSGQAGDTQKISKGKIYQSGKFYYRVLSETEKTVAVAGPVKKAEKNIIIPSSVSINGVTCSVREIGTNAFQNNKKLQRVTVGKNVAKIGKCAFKGCKNLKTVKIQNKKLSNVGKNAFQNVNRKCKIKVPSSKLKQYKKLFKGKGQAKSVKITK